MVHAVAALVLTLPLLVAVLLELLDRLAFAAGLDQPLAGGLDLLLKLHTLPRLLMCCHLHTQNHEIPSPYFEAFPS